MTLQTSEKDRSAARVRWLSWIDALFADISLWAKSRHWSTHFDRKHITEDEFGRYSVPTLRLRLPGGIVHVEPVAYDVVGAKGRVDLEGWPSLHRVILLRSRNTWRCISETGEPLKQPWGEATFARLAKELIDQA